MRTLTSSERNYCSVEGGKIKGRGGSVIEEWGVVGECGVGEAGQKGGAKEQRGRLLTGRAAA